MSWFKDWKEKRKLSKYMKKTPEEEYEIYRRRLLRGESEESARTVNKHFAVFHHCFFNFVAYNIH